MENKPDNNFKSITFNLILKWRRVGIVLFFLFLFTRSIANWVIPPYTTQGILDETKILESDELDSISKFLINYSDTSDYEILIVINQGLTGSSINDDAKKEFKNWELRKNNQFNNILLYIVLDSKSSIIIASDNLKKVLTEAKGAQITHQIIDASFSKKHYYDGMMEALKAITGSIRGDYHLKPYLNPEFSIDSFIVPSIIFAIFIGLLIYFNLRTFFKVRNTMHTYQLNNTEARILLGLDRPNECIGGGWKDFKGGGAAGSW